MTIKGRRIGELLKKTGSEVLSDNVPGLAAQSAYSFFFSLFPILLFLAPLFSIVGDEQKLVNGILTRLAASLPPEAYLLLQNVVRDVVFAENAPGLMSVGILLALFSGSAVVGTVMGALNEAYGVKDDRPWWKKRLLAVVFMLGAGFVIAFAMSVMFAGETVIGFLSNMFGWGTGTARMWTVIQYPLALSLVIGFMWLTYYFLPQVEQEKSHILVGSVCAVILWVLITIGFRYYVVNFGAYNKTYGTIGGVIILLTWMYLTMLVVLVCGELNSELHCGTGRIDGPSPAKSSARLEQAAIAERARF